MTVCQTDENLPVTNRRCCSFVQGPAVSVFEDRSTGQWRQHGITAFLGKPLKSCLSLSIAVLSHVSCHEFSGPVSGLCLALGFGFGSHFLGVYVV